MPFSAFFAHSPNGSMSIVAASFAASNVSIILFLYSSVMSRRFCSVLYCSCMSLMSACVCSSTSSSPSPSSPVAPAASSVEPATLFAASAHFSWSLIYGLRSSEVEFIRSAASVSVSLQSFNAVDALTTFVCNSRYCLPSSDVGLPSKSVCVDNASSSSALFPEDVMKLSKDSFALS